MKPRSVKFGDYETADHGWTLTGYALSDPEQKTHYIEKTGGDGSWDLSTALTDGIPRYKTRELAVRLENSTGDRAHRQELISEMVNKLDGMECQVQLPDYPDHYITARLHVSVEYSDPAHAAVNVTGTCSPWLEKRLERISRATATETEKTLLLVNEGRRVLVPELTVEGGSARLRFGEYFLQVSAGVYTWPELVLTPGVHKLYYSGDCALSVKYREAVLR